MASTLTDLAGYPMVMSVSQNAINKKMAMEYQSGDDSRRFPSVPWNLGPDDGSWKLEVDQFAAPEVDFNTPLEMGCRLKMTIMNGHFTTWVFKGMVGGKPNMEEQNVSLNGLTMYVTTPMRQLKHDTWSDELFECQALFADLENMREIVFDLNSAMRLAILGSVESYLKTVIADYITEYGNAHPQALVFGAVKIPKIATADQTTGLLKPSALAFSVFKITNPGGYVSGNLNYLMWKEDPKAIPTGAAAGVFNASLVRPGEQATFIISEATVLETIANSLIKTQFGANIDLGLTRGVYGQATAKSYLNTAIPFGVTLNNRGRSASLESIDSTVEDGKIKIQYRVKTSMYQQVNDIDIDVTAYRLVSIYLEGEKLKVEVSAPTQIAYHESFGSVYSDFQHICEFALWKQEDFCSDLLDNLNLPGNFVWKFTSLTLDQDRQLYITAAYE
jgi:hypothetical protein